MRDILGRPFANSVEVHNAVELLRDASVTIEEKVAAAVAPNPLEGVKLAAYYGCLLVRPFEVCGNDDPEQPTSMDEVINACGADDVDWDMKVECCGSAFSVSRTASVLRLGRAIIDHARAHGAAAPIVARPLRPPSALKPWVPAPSVSVPISIIGPITKAPRARRVQPIGRGTCSDRAARRMWKRPTISIGRPMPSWVANKEMAIITPATPSA